MIFTGAEYVALASVAGDVPVIAVGGLAKRFLVPGWRLGWIAIYDPRRYLDKMREGLFSLTQLILGANSVIQAAVPSILRKTPQEFHEETNKKLEDRANYSLKLLSQIPGLFPLSPQGTLYMMVRIDIAAFKDIADDVDFMRKLFVEESVLVLPGQCFRSPNFFRIVYCAPLEKLGEAFKRVASFCANHQIK